MKNWIIGLTIIVFIASCEKVVDLSFEGSEPRLFLECFPSNDNDTTWISLTLAKPLNEKSEEKDLSGSLINFEVGDKSYDVSFCHRSGNVFMFKTLAEMSCGDLVQLQASLDGLPSILTRSTIPEKKDFSVERTLDEMTNAYIVTTIKFDVPQENLEKYFGICVWEKHSLETVYSESGECFVSQTEKVVKCLAESPKTMQNMLIGGKEMLLLAVVPDDNKGKIEAIVKIPYSKDTYRVICPEYKTFRRTEYKIELYVIEQEAYKYLNLQWNPYLQASGLIPPFSNAGLVEGGYGIFSCMGKSSTLWLGNL